MRFFVSDEVENVVSSTNKSLCLQGWNGHAPWKLELSRLSPCFGGRWRTKDSLVGWRGQVKVAILNVVCFLWFRVIFICFFYIIPQQRKLLGFSAQISSGVCRCGSQEQVPEEGSGRFRRVPACAGVSFGGRFRKVPECWCSFCRVPACAGVGSGGRFRKVPEGSGVCWCRFRRLGKFQCVVV